MAQREHEEHPLKLIIMSATIDPEKFKKYFHCAEYLSCPERQFPVNVKYDSDIEDLLATLTLEDKFADQTVKTRFDLKKAIDYVLNINRIDKDGKILVFLTGADEIDCCAQDFEVEARKAMSQTRQLLILRAYAKMPWRELQQILEKTPQGQRKVILATNLCESSITVDGVRFVIDSGLVKILTFAHDTLIEVLEQQRISREQADQRKGRAGRTATGVCYRLYSESIFNLMPVSQRPALLRENLCSTMLVLKMIGVSDPSKFEFIDPPDATHVGFALENLTLLGALDANGEVTPLGKLVCL